MFAAEDVEEDIRSIEPIGHRQYGDFVRSKLRSDNAKLSDSFKLNNLQLLASKKRRKKGSKFKFLRENYGMFAQLYISCQTRTTTLEEIMEFFSHENHRYPPSLAENGVMRLPSSKSDLEKCLLRELKNDEANTSSPATTCTVFDGAFMVQVIRPQPNTTFETYAYEFSKKIINSYLNNNSTRIDVIFDRYFDKTTKAARIKRGDSSRRVVNPDKQVPKVWGEFLKNQGISATAYKKGSFPSRTCVGMFTQNNPK